MNGDVASFGFSGSGTAGGHTIYRLGAGVDHYLLADLNQLLSCGGAGSVPILWDQVATDITSFNHVPAGINVLHLDGHVEFRRYDKESLNGGIKDKDLPYCP